jgi:hypothetical protein
MEATNSNTKSRNENFTMRSKKLLCLMCDKTTNAKGFKHYPHLLPTCPVLNASVLT